MIPVSKNELLAELELQYKKVRTAFAAFPEEQSRHLCMEGHAAGTLMSAHNLLAYLCGWAGLVLKWYDARTKGEEPVFPESGYRWNELGRLAQKFYADHETLSYPELLALSDRLNADICQLLGRLSNEELYGKPWYRTYTLGRMIQLNTVSPYKNARARLRNVLKAAKK